LGAVNENGEGKADTSISVAPIRLRAQSSTGRSASNIKRIKESKEIENCRSYMAQCEIKMRKATELRRKQQDCFRENMHNLTSRVNEKVFHVAQ